MAFKDKACVCRDCEKEFIFTAQEQREFHKRGFGPPTRCVDCHERRSARRNYRRGSDGTTFSAPCSKCGKTAQIPFRPTDDKPVYCAECFGLQRNETVASAPTKFIAKKVQPVSKAAKVKLSNSQFDQFDFDPRIFRAICEAGYDVPTPVQGATIPLALKGRDLVGTAQTGTGKTAAFVLPILQHLLTTPPTRKTRVIVLTPTRELAEQINDSFRSLGRYTGIRSATVYGGVGMIPQERALRSGVEIIVACPGRLLDHIGRGSANLSGVEKLVLDEADRMLDMGFLPPIRKILSNIPQNRQSMLFSATFAPELNDLVADTLNNPKRVEMGISAPAKTVAHALYPCPQHLKTPMVLRLLNEIEVNSVLIFTRTKHRANRVAEQIEKAGYGVVALHSNKSQNQRQLALNDFKSGRSQVLVATDIAARGLDVETISHVINYDIPDTADTYIHRIGRTGRAEREGDAMTLVTKEDAGIVWDIEKVLGRPIKRRQLEDFDYGTPGAAKTEVKKPAPRVAMGKRDGRQSGFSSRRSR